MLIHRLIACFIVATSLVAAAEARASCADPTQCICPFASGLNVTFAGTIVEGKASDAQIEVQLDALSLVGTATQLAVGDVISVSGALGNVNTGPRVIGFTTLDCTDGTFDCDPKTKVETPVLKLISAADKTFVCGSTSLPVSAESLATSMASTGCSSEVRKLLEDLGADTSCHDGGLCSARPGPASSGGWALLLGIAALIGVRRARR